MLLIIAMIMGGGYLVIVYIYNLQKDTEKRIDAARQSVNVAREMEMELVRLRGFTFTYLVDPTPQWLDSIKTREIRFIVLLERARANANTDEEVQVIQQISGLFSNYKQNIIQAEKLFRRWQYTKANALLVFAAKDLLSTIHEKSRNFIALNIEAEKSYELDIAKANTIIRRTMISLGLGGILAGLLLGWIISRMVLNPINQLILQVRGASGGAYLEKLEMAGHGDLEELGNRIRSLIEGINKTQEALEKNRQLLQYSNKYAVLGKVAPTLAHEIRNPLAAIKMLIYSIKEEQGDNGPLQEDFVIISNEIDRMEAFIRNFLKFARPPDPVFEKINPLEVLHEVLHLLNPKYKKNQISLLDHTEGSRYRVNADASQLKQLLMNLVINALEAMPEGGALSLSTGIQEGPGVPEGDSGTKYLVINIEDTGPGLPQKVLDHLFEPFIKGNDQGVGLGLSISQNIASMHKGWIEAKNKPENAGAVFSVILPLVPEV